jgi:hypothetical protein
MAEDMAAGKAEGTDNAALDHRQAGMADKAPDTAGMAEGNPVCGNVRDLE